MTREDECYRKAYQYAQMYHSEADNDFQNAMNIAVQKAFIAGAKWADKTIFEKACKWLEENVSEYEDIYYDVGGFVSPEFRIEEFINDFKKAML